MLDPLFLYGLAIFLIFVCIFRSSRTSVGPGANKRLLSHVHVWFPEDPFNIPISDPFWEAFSWSKCTGFAKVRNGTQWYAMVHNGTQWYTMVQIGTRKKQFSRTVKSCLLLVIVYTIASQYLIHFVNPMHRVHFFISHAIVRLPFRGLLWIHFSFLFCDQFYFNLNVWYSIFEFEIPFNTCCRLNMMSEPLFVHWANSIFNVDNN